jgi:hypothetical protein
MNRVKIMSGQIVANRSKNRDSVIWALWCTHDVIAAIHDILKTGQEYFKNASRFEKEIGSTPDCFSEHVQNCRECMNMFQDLSRIIKNHHDCITVSSRIYNNNPDVSSRDHSGQTSGQCGLGFSDVTM